MQFSPLLSVFSTSNRWFFRIFAKNCSQNKYKTTNNDENITGLTPGQHSLKAYHNNSDKNQVQPDIDISVDGTVVATGQKFTSAAQSTLEAGTSFITFNVTEGQPVVITYTTKLEAGVAYTNTRMMLNGLEFDAVAMVATDPQPENHDFHAGTEDGTIHFSWLAAPGAVSHKLVFGTDSTQVATSDTYEYEGTATEYVKTDLYALQQYWWRVDEVDSDGNVHRGKAWTRFKGFLHSEEPFRTPNLFLDQRGKPKDNDCTDDGCAELTKDAAPGNAEHVKQPSTEDSTKETKHNIHDDAETATFHQLAGTEASQTSKKKRKNNTHNYTV